MWMSRHPQSQVAEHYASVSPVAKPGSGRLREASHPCGDGGTGEKPSRRTRAARLGSL